MKRTIALLAVLVLLVSAVASPASAAGLSPLGERLLPPQERTARLPPSRSFFRCRQREKQQTRRQPRLRFPPQTMRSR